LKGLVSVARSGNAIMTYQNNQLNIAMAANIRQIAVSEYLKFRLMKLFASWDKMLSVICEAWLHKNKLNINCVGALEKGLQMFTLFKNCNEIIIQLVLNSECFYWKCLRLCLFLRSKNEPKFRYNKDSYFLGTNLCIRF
jgi:hypothetical protein